MAEQKGIVEIKELFKSLEELASFAGLVMKDGRVGAEDIVHLVSLASKFETITKGFSGLGEAVSEAKDLDQSEVIELIGAAYKVIKAFEESKS